MVSYLEMDIFTPTTLTKTMQRKLRAELRQKVYIEAELCGPLRGAALAMIDYAYAFSPPWEDISAPYFKKKTEWILEPDPWIALRFAYGRAHVIHVSVGVRTLCIRDDLPLKNGRFRNWTRFSVTSPQQLPSAMLYLEEAYFDSDSGYRKRHGKPRRIKTNPKSYNARG